MAGCVEGQCTKGKDFVKDGDYMRACVPFTSCRFNERLGKFSQDNPLIYLLPLMTQEFEDAKFEPDPEIINKLVITGRDAVQRTVEAFWKRRKTIIEEETLLQDARRTGTSWDQNNP